MLTTGAPLPELESHLERQMRSQERQLVVARFAIVAASAAAIIAFRDDLASAGWLLGLAGAVAAYNVGILFLLRRLSAREVGIVATVLDMIVVTLGIYAEPGALDAYLFYWPVVLGVALRFGLWASIWASAVVAFLYGSVVVLTASASEPVRALLVVRLAYLVGLGVASGVFARVVIARAAENAQLQERLLEEQRERARAREDELLSQMAREFGTSLDLGTTGLAILHAAAPLLGDVAWLLLVEPTNDASSARLVLTEVAGRSPEPADRLRAHLAARSGRVGEGICGAAAATATAVMGGEDHPLEAAAGDPDGIALLGLRSVLAVPIVSRGRVRGVLAAGTIGSPRFAEGELRLAEAIAERAGPALDNATLWAELQEQMERVQEAQRIKDDFLSIVSHELRTPLTSIQGYAQLLEARLRDSAGGKELSQLGVIRSQVTRMRRLVDDLLDVSRIDRAGAVSIEPQPIDLADELHEAAARTERQHADRQVTLELPGPLPLTADRDRIGQVLTNLLDNAVKYSPDGGPIVLRAVDLGAEVEVTVADAGIGIPPEQIDHVFERFFQADAGDHGRRFGGLGLGLYITRAIVEAHGGSIRAEPNAEAGHGTLIRMRLPRTPGAVPVVLPDPSQPPPFVADREPSDG